MLSSIYRQTGVRILFAAARACPVRAFATGAQQRPALPLEKAIAQPDLLVLDVTSEMEFSEGHHPEAINIPTQLIGERIEELGADKTRPILVYCKKGVRAGMVTNALMQNGFVNAFATTDKSTAQMLTDKFGVKK
ncbi:Thiosulfate sulfurtransferase glpE, putative [Perkinsus marinus ATCC 50983]|uniref:Thiosulfate sulfurtransferase glpE, putative n=1 Tax=Perkinsus marinus (strain ATCC 50983 / TXsc) TaxID=423536 RepID=C5KK91_PERM5|nr:Thiosulfate sulfurtransferase glpE, putative [Perkinsus marinus ATCC 50983]EER15003.1 Thiosulfate sulfurtransferase glpE, putative [Perkinsus marinus ATCC 50983]|eukprot:XP_002783207.1 Thiosulfate sulfurtransferase glpE, putative [Perkinsus marinus ATCC 50983]